MYFQGGKILYLPKKLFILKYLCNIFPIPFSDLEDYISVKIHGEKIKIGGEISFTENAIAPKV